jgi:hypothetical protein
MALKPRCVVPNALMMLAIVLAGAMDPAAAAIVYSFSNVPMTDGVVGDQTLYASGSFSISSRNSGPIPVLTSQQSSPGFVNFTVTNGGSFVRSFVAASYFGYADGRSLDGSYFVDLGPNERDLNLDSHYDQLYLTIVNDVEISAVFSTLDFAQGFTSPNLVPNVFAEVPESGTLPLMILGFVRLAVIRLSRRRRSWAGSEGRS